MKSYTRISYPFIVFVLGLLLVCCEKKPEGPETDPDPDPDKKENTVIRPDFLDIQDAESLVVIDEPLKKGTAGNGNRHGNMYKHGKNGDLKAVGFLDQNGNAVDSIVWYNSDGSYMISFPSLYVTAINRLTEDYILIDGTFQYLAVSDSTNPVDMYIQSILLRESDGAIFDFGDQINWAVSSRYWNNYLYTDEKQGILSGLKVCYKYQSSI